MQRRILHEEPLIEGFLTLSLNEPCPTVVALDVRATRVRSPEATTGDKEVVEPTEHGLFDPHDAQPSHSLTMKEVDHSQVVKLHGQVKARWGVKNIGARNPRGAHR